MSLQSSQKYDDCHSSLVLLIRFSKSEFCMIPATYRQVYVPYIYIYIYIYIIIISTFYCRFPRKRGLAGVIPIAPSTSLHLGQRRMEGGSGIFEAGRIPSALQRMPLSTDPLLGKLGGCSLTSCPRTYIYIYIHCVHGKTGSQ